MKKLRISALIRRTKEDLKTILTETVSQWNGKSYGMIEFYKDGEVVDKTNAYRCYLNFGGAYLYRIAKGDEISCTDFNPHDQAMANFLQQLIRGKIEGDCRELFSFEFDQLEWEFNHFGFDKNNYNSLGSLIDFIETMAVFFEEKGH